MGSDQIRQQVREALRQQWDEFATKHPALARAMDQETLTERCMRDLRDDTEFREAMDMVKTAPLFAPVITETVTRLVRTGLGRL